LIWIKQQPSDLDIRFVPMTLRLKIIEGGKVTCGDWATACGFAWAEGAVPGAWIAEPARTSAASWRATVPAPD
jgi:hypothetical protein